MTAEPLFQPPQAEDRDRVFALLAALGVDEIIYSLNGSGDSGDSDLDGVRYADGRDATGLPAIAIGFHADGQPRMLAAYLDDLASDEPDGDWVNNEGGYGTVTFRPRADEPCERVECDMTYREEGDYGDDEDPDDFEDELIEPVEIVSDPDGLVLVIEECGQ